VGGAHWFLQLPVTQQCLVLSFPIITAIQSLSGPSHLHLNCPLKRPSLVAYPALHQALQKGGLSPTYASIPSFSLHGSVQSFSSSLDQPLTDVDLKSSASLVMQVSGCTQWQSSNLPTRYMLWPSCRVVHQNQARQQRA